MPRVQKFLILFSSSYLVERGHKIAENLSRGDYLRMPMTKIEPNINKLSTARPFR